MFSSIIIRPFSRRISYIVNIIYSILRVKRDLLGNLNLNEEGRLMPSHVLARMATTGIYLLHGIPRDVQQAARVRAVREATTLRAVLLRALNEYAAGAWPLRRKDESA